MRTFALVGKPNVGKSTLFNRFAKKRLAIVNEKPGITRDRNMAVIDYRGHHFMLIDTGGFEAKTDEIIPQKMREQSQLAIEEADAIIFVMDKSTGWTPQDQAIYDLLRRSEKPVYLAVNKIDSDQHEYEIAEFYESGADKIFPVSAEHGRGIPTLLEALAEEFPDIAEDDKDQSADDELSIAIVGRPNAGKSSLVNQFLGQIKQIVHDEPGTTRDPIDNYLTHYGKVIRLIDTAGIRKKSRVSFIVDRYSMVAALKSIERSDVVLLMIDATEGVVEQDARIAGHILDRNKALVIIVNKWDLVQKDGKTMDAMTQDIRDKLRFLDFAPIVFVSAKTGKRVPIILDKVKEIHAQYIKRIQTADLNRILQSVTVRHTPPNSGRRLTKLYYGTQVSTRPPTFVITTNNPKAITNSYQRYIVAQFRHHFGFDGTPIRIIWRDRTKKNKSGETSA